LAAGDDGRALGCTVTDEGAGSVHSRGDGAHAYDGNTETMGGDP
jgi:hypothetical protein